MQLLYSPKLKFLDILSHLEKNYISLFLFKVNVFKIKFSSRAINTQRIVIVKHKQSDLCRAGSC